MIPNIGLNLVGKLPIIDDALSTLTGDQQQTTPLSQSLEKVIQQNPALGKELTSALSATLNATNSGTNPQTDGQMPKELEGILKGAVDIAASMIPGGQLVKGILGKIF